MISTVQSHDHEGSPMSEEINKVIVGGICWKVVGFVPRVKSELVMNDESRWFRLIAMWFRWSSTRTPVWTRCGCCLRLRPSAIQRTSSSWRRGPGDCWSCPPTCPPTDRTIATVFTSLPRRSLALPSLQPSVCHIIIIIIIFISP